MDTKQKYATRDQAAKATGLTPNAITHRIRNGQLTAIQHPGDRRRILIPITQIQDLKNKLNAATDLPDD